VFLAGIQQAGQTGCPIEALGHDVAISDRKSTWKLLYYDFVVYNRRSNFSKHGMHNVRPDRRRVRVSIVLSPHSSLGTELGI
jgi:hypothetical protein